MEGPFHARFFVLLSRGAAPAALMTLFPVRDCVPWPFPRGDGWKKHRLPTGDGAFAFFAHNFLRSLRAFYFFFAAAAVRRRLVALERDGRDKVFHAQHLVGKCLVDELPEIRLGRDGAALALKLSGAERVRSVEELRQILDRVTVEVVNGLLDAEFFDLV